jgi:nucleotide-binding universal stress UspA family protein
MSILCTTNFSPRSQQAARAAAALAQRMHEPLTLIHVIDELGAELTVGSENDVIYEPLRRDLRTLAESLRHEFSVDVTTWIGPGFTDRTVAGAAEVLHVSFVVVSTDGPYKLFRWLLGSVGTDIARLSPAPVLMVRNARNLELWARGERPLTIVVGVKPGESSRAALIWAAGLRRIGRCDIVVTQFSEQSAATLPEREKNLRDWAGELPGPGDSSFVVAELDDNTDARLCAFAVETGADLLVVGAHRRTWLDRLLHPSVSRNVVHHSSSNVACIPLSSSAFE